eukprot:gene5020-10044_t
MNIFRATIVCVFCLSVLPFGKSFRIAKNLVKRQQVVSKASYLDDLNIFKASEKKCLVGFTTDSWNIGQRKYKEFLAVYNMYKRVQKVGLACIEIPMWEIAQGPHFDELQRLFESYWIPDMTSTDQFLLQQDLIIIPDPVLAKYMVEAYHEKEAKVVKQKAYYDKLIKQPWGVLEAYPPKEKYQWERIQKLREQKWIRKFPPLAVCGEEAYKRIKNHGQVEYFAYGAEDFSLYLPDSLIPRKRVLMLRFKNRFDNLATSLHLRDISVTSAYPITWMRKDWSPQEDRLAKEVDVVYFHDCHAVTEWHERMPNHDVIAACHDEEVGRVAKASGFKDVFYAKKSDTDGLVKTVLQATEFFKNEKNTLKK